MSEDIIEYLKNIMEIYDHDIFSNRKEIEVFFSKDIPSKRIFNYINHRLKIDHIDYKLLKKNATSFVMQIDNVNIVFKKSQYI